MPDEMYDAMCAEYEAQQSAIGIYEDKIEKELEEMNAYGH